MTAKVDASAAPSEKPTEAAAAAPTAADTDRPTATHTDIPTAAHTPSATPKPSDTPTVTHSPTATLPAAGLQGSQDLLTLYRSARSDPFWNDSRFSLQDGSWRLGVDSQTRGETLFFYPPAELLNQQFGNDAPRRISRIEANLTLRSFNPAVVSDEEVYFGILFQSTSSADNAGIKILAVQANAINLALYENSETDFISQRSVNALIARLRLDRDPTSGRVTAFFNDSQIGEPMRAIAANDAVVPVIFVKDGGVTVGVTAWQITLD